ncbi:F-box domain-containing protein [Heracleum sosnowskyi]|uniref:F-box domain-containing protein n=1 Tax=Heracleum sosnowskyi TaxID=360622 RepID=A0AAD8MM10_9APIA|nr:F-box domain-containing protein [Heracleum sosnowskyi]
MSSSKPCRPDSSGIIDDLLNLILLRLHVKSLLRCKAVSKPWCSLISSSLFINSHYTRAITSPGADQTFILRNQEDGSFSLLRLSPSPIVAELKFPYSQGEYPVMPKSVLIGSAKGIACVSVSLDKSSYCDKCPPDIYLWNPATRQSRLLPPQNVYCSRSSVESCGFGYDPINNDFKVVVVFHYPHRVDVYSTNMNAWQKAGRLPPDTYFGQFSVCFEGFLCWNRLIGIVAFDLNREVFNCDTKFPDGLSNDGHTYLRITDFNYSVAVIKEEGFYGKTKLWMLDNVKCLLRGGGVASWTLIVSIDAADLPIPYVRSYFNNGDFLLISNDHNCFSYDSDKKEAKKLHITNSFVGGQMSKFTESLVSIPGSRPVEWNAHEDNN